MAATRAALGHRTPPATTGCHDITAYPSRQIAAGACMGDGIIMDISDPAAPRVIEQVRDTENFAFWHSATFNNKGTKVIFTDELGGGGAATCNDADRREPRRQRDLRPVSRQPADLQVVLQDPAPPVRHRELRRAQRLDRPARRARRHGPVLVPGRHLGLGLHRLRATRGRSATSSAARWQGPAGRRWHVVERTTTTVTSTARTSGQGLRRPHAQGPDAEEGCDAVRLDQFNPQSQPVYPIR